MSSKKPLLILMDGHAMVYRAWHAIQQPLNLRTTGEDVRAVYGFLNSFLRTIADFNPTHCIIAFDTPGPTFRHDHYTEYKAHRPPMPEELRSQFTHIRTMMNAFEIPIFEEDKYEADDVIGTICKKAEKEGIETLILTGDTDELQLVSPLVKVMLSHSVQGKSLYDIKKVQERYEGLGPETVPDIKALEGDKSDNIPGVPGIGKKTAIRLLKEFGSIEKIYAHLEKVHPPKVQNDLRENHNQTIQGKFLTTIVKDVPLQVDFGNALFWKYNRENVIKELKDLEFFSMVDRLPKSSDHDLESRKNNTYLEHNQYQTKCTIVDTTEKLDSLIKSLESSDEFAFDTETTSLNAMEAKLVGLSFSNVIGSGWYIPVGHAEGNQLKSDDVIEKLRPILENKSISKYAHNANYDLTVLKNYSINIQNLSFDTMLAAHVTGRKSIGLKALALECLQIEMTPITELIGTGKTQLTMDQIPITDTAEYAAADSDITLRLYRFLEKELQEKNSKKLLDQIETPLIPILVRMQTNGIKIDVDLLLTMSEEIGSELSIIEDNIFALVGHQFNLKSSQQLGEILFKELKLPNTKKTKTGYSTDAQSLEGLKIIIDQNKIDSIDSRAYTVLNQVLEYRQLSKIKSTYVDSLPTLVNPVTGKIHTKYNQTGSATGRLSSNDPNVQNIPVRTNLGRRVRKAFIPGNIRECILLAADYSQIELRVLAHLSLDPNLVKAFQQNQDIHASTASSIYGINVKDVLPEMRRIAKIMNFGVLYGLSPFGISQQTDLSSEEGKTFIDTYFGMYPKIQEYLDSIKLQVKQFGYVQTLMGRRRYIPEINSTNFNVRSAGERMAINMPIQGTASEIMKIAMIKIQDKIDSMNMKSKMIIQVHDELIFETPIKEISNLKEIVSELMPTAMDLVVPLEIKIKSGPTWDNMQ